MSDRYCYRVRLSVGGRRYAPIVSAESASEAGVKARNIVAGRPNATVPWGIDGDGSRHWQPEGGVVTQIVALHPDTHVGLITPCPVTRGCVRHAGHRRSCKVRIDGKCVRKQDDPVKEEK
jgi:hypothetical protein